MADRIITVTDPSVVTNDTLSGYNNYSDIDGQLGTTMTPTEATNGHTVALSDGVVHEVTTKPVGTTNGEFSAVVSNAVTVDLTAGDLLLDLYPNALSAYSLQQIKTGVTNVVKVRRISDAAELDFTAAEVADGTLATWAAGTDAFVTTLYDQSGNLNDMTQLDSFQPQIVASGVVVTSNSIPAIDFLVGAAKSLRSVGAALTDDLFSIHMAFELRSTTATQTVLSQHAAAVEDGRASFPRVTTNLTEVLFINNGVSNSGLYSTSWEVGQQLYSVYGNGTGDYTVQKTGGTVETVLTGQAWTPLNERLVIGAQTNTTNDFEGLFKEVIIWGSDQSANRTAINTNISDRY